MDQGLMSSPTGPGKEQAYCFNTGCLKKKGKENEKKGKTVAKKFSKIGDLLNY